LGELAQGGQKWKERKPEGKDLKRGGKKEEGKGQELWGGEKGKEFVGKRPGRYSICQGEGKLL